MVPKVSTVEYSARNKYNQNFGTVIPKNNNVLIKKRGDYILQNVVINMFERVKNIFFEMFPKLDPEYKRMMKLKVK